MLFVISLHYLLFTLYNELNYYNVIMRVKMNVRFDHIYIAFIKLKIIFILLFFLLF